MLLQPTIFSLFFFFGCHLLSHLRGGVLLTPNGVIQYKPEREQGEAMRTLVKSMQLDEDSDLRPEETGDPSVAVRKISCKGW
jgi:hypothetical protein